MSKILLVEDNEKNRDILSRRLERKDSEVVTVVNSQAGFGMASFARADSISLTSDHSDSFETRIA